MKEIKFIKKLRKLEKKVMAFVIKCDDKQREAIDEMLEARLTPPFEDPKKKAPKKKSAVPPNKTFAAKVAVRRKKAVKKPVAKKAAVKKRRIK